MNMSLTVILDVITPHLKFCLNYTVGSQFTSLPSGPMASHFPPSCSQKDVNTHSAETELLLPCKSHDVCSSEYSGAKHGKVLPDVLKFNNKDDQYSWICVGGS